MTEPRFDAFQLVMNLPLLAVVASHKPYLFRLDYDGFRRDYAHASSLMSLLIKSKQWQLNYSCNNRVINVENKNNEVSRCFY